MARMSISAAREHLADVVESAGREPVVLERHGREAAVVISPQRYAELLEVWEEAEDIAAFDEALGEAGANIPWDQVKADLGWV